MLRPIFFPSLGFAVYVGKSRSSGQLIRKLFSVCFRRKPIPLHHLTLPQHRLVCKTRCIRCGSSSGVGGFGFGRFYLLWEAVDSLQLEEAGQGTRAGRKRMGWSKGDAASRVRENSREMKLEGKKGPARGIAGPPGQEDRCEARYDSTSLSSSGMSFRSSSLKEWTSRQVAASVPSCLLDSERKISTEYRLMPALSVFFQIL